MCAPIVDDEECLHEYFTAEHPVTGVLTVIANRGRRKSTAAAAAVLLLCVVLYTECFVDPVPWIILAVIFVAVFSIGLAILLIIKCIIMYLVSQCLD